MFASVRMAQDDYRLGVSAPMGRRDKVRIVCLDLLVYVLERGGRLDVASDREAQPCDRQDQRKQQSALGMHPAHRVLVRRCDTGPGLE